MQSCAHALNTLIYTCNHALMHLYVGKSFRVLLTAPLVNTALIFVKDLTKIHLQYSFESNRRNACVVKMVESHLTSFVFVLMGPPPEIQE